jgi:hypothetical protein
VHRGTNAEFGEPGPSGIALGEPGHAEVVGVALVRGLPPEVGRGLAVAGGDVPTTLVPGGQVWESESQPGGLDLAEAEVLRHLVVHVLRGHPMRAEPSDSIDQVAVGRHHGAAVADPAEILGGVEAVCDGCRPSIVAECPLGLSGIFDDGQIGVGQRGRPTVEMDDHHGAGAGGARWLHQTRVEVGCVGLDVDEHRGRAQGRDGRGCRHRGEGRHDHLVTRAHPEGAQGELQRRGPRRNGNGVRRLLAATGGPPGQIGFEASGLVAEQVHATARYVCDLGREGVGHLCAPTAQVDDRYHGCLR